LSWFLKIQENEPEKKVGSDKFFTILTFKQILQRKSSRRSSDFRNVSFEWLLGIGLIVTFALLVKGVRFGFIRDLLGF